ncbi:hypothetical protein [Dyella ginsengisoli]|uniref:hypothetical protein n=1 Tax=Dyella ginsengisoli TaxID=363848 RepID=UPI0003717E30|nr:hypothetical protein [Dyella ginsengisoli]
MNVLRQRPVLTAFVAIFFLLLLAGAAWTWQHTRVTDSVAMPPPGMAVDDAVVLSRMEVSLTARKERGGYAYSVAIAVQGARTFTMPVQFFKAMRPVPVSPDEAARFADAWVKARATGIAQFGTVDPKTGPYLLIDVDNPGAH